MGKSNGTTSSNKTLAVTVEIFSAGDGVNYPRKGQTVTIHYTAYLADGTMFDSSRSRKRPLRFKLGCGYVIPGIDDGVTQDQRDPGIISSLVDGGQKLGSLHFITTIILSPNRGRQISVEVAHRQANKRSITFV